MSRLVYKNVGTLIYNQKPTKDFYNVSESLQGITIRV